MLEQIVIFQVDQQKMIIESLTGLISNNDVPMHIRNKLASNFCLIVKNKTLTKGYLQQDDPEALKYLKPIF